MIKHAINMVVVAGLMFLMAWMFLKGWDLQHDIDCKKPAPVAGVRVVTK